MRLLSKSNWYLPYIPIIGIITYVVLFFISKNLYGGGFESYIMNEHLLCDMMEKQSKGGIENTARSFAVLGHTILFIGMAIFFYLLPLDFKRDKYPALFQIAGVSSMILFVFLSTDYHDLFVLIAGSLATLSGFLLIFEYSKQKPSAKSIFSILCLTLSILVFASYQFTIYIEHLPVFQKTVFVFDSAWVFWVCLGLKKTYIDDVLDVA